MQVVIIPIQNKQITHSINLIIIANIYGSTSFYSSLKNYSLKDEVQQFD